MPTATEAPNEDRRPNEGGPTFNRTREPGSIRTQATLFFIVSIAAIGAVMMTLISSPTARGASFLWLPAALQLLAGVWLGPWRGAIAGGVGAYLAGILAYGGWGPVDIIMNLVAGGVANSFLPAVLFKLFRVDPTLGTDATENPTDILQAAGRIALLVAIVLIAAFAVRPLHIGAWGHSAPFVLLLMAPALLLKLRLSKRHFLIALLISVFISAVSAAIGVAGQVVGGQTWQAASVGIGVGWFLGDTVSAVLGLYCLAAFTRRAREAGLAQP